VYDKNKSLKIFIKTRIESIFFVLKGIYLLIKTEDSIKAQTIILFIFTLLGIYVNLTIEDWKWQLFCFALIFTAEGLNTAIEKICDFVHPNYHHKIGFIKDISAGAVGFAVLFGLIISVLIYSKYVSF